MQLIFLSTGVWEMKVLRITKYAQILGIKDTHARYIFYRKYVNITYLKNKIRYITKDNAIKFAINYAVRLEKPLDEILREIEEYRPWLLASELEKGTR